MSGDVRPVQSFYLRFERIADPEAAREAWRWYVLAHGWSKVGEPEVMRYGDPMNREWTPYVIGRLVKTDEPLDLAPTLTDAVRLT